MALIFWRFASTQGVTAAASRVLAEFVIVCERESRGVYEKWVVTSHLAADSNRRTRPKRSVM